jgi:hypothetical protein
MSQRVIGNLRNLKELVPIDTAAPVLVQLHESLFQTYEFCLGDCLVA